MQEKNTQNVEKVLSRLISAFNVRGIKELSDIFGIQPAAIYNWKGRKGINYNVIVTKCLEYGISCDYVVGLKPEKDCLPQAREPEINYLVSSDNYNGYLEKRIVTLEYEVDKLKNIILSIQKKTK